MEILIDTVIDNLKLFPFLFITYLFLEYLEHKTSDKATEFIRKAGIGGPLIGALCGILPQCGFSVAAANFYAARIISLGTLIAVYLSTSDEMLPILISNAVSAKIIAAILTYKALCGMFFGYIINFIWHKYHSKENIDIEQLCENENCHCEEGIIKPALHHSVRITLFIFVVTLILNFAINKMNISELTTYLQLPLLGELLSALIGFIPNCSSSVILTQLYLENYINIGTLLSGSLVSSGVGILVLFRVNRRLKENIFILALLYICGVLGGLLSHLVFII
ncbi:MAG: arsenic efflux protein [Alphaproteobacteria bacterium]|nr:arsenic efflux protein [Alphaproteobacteria bacterium]